MKEKTFTDPAMLISPIHPFQIRSKNKIKQNKKKIQHSLKCKR